MLAVSAAMAHGASGQTSVFHIKPQALDLALLQYSEQSGLELIAVGDLSGIKGRFGVAGKLDDETALRMLLHGSGLHYEFQGNGMVIVTAAPAPSASSNERRVRPGHSMTAQPASARQMAEVTVTARLHHEKMIDVPISMTAMTGEEIQALGLRNVSAVVRMTPGVGSIDYGGGFTSVQVRGVSGSLGGNANGYYLDGVPFTGVTVPWFPDARSWDIDRVEVLKGPQGTTFGEGSMGGTIRIITRKPDFNQVEAAIDLSGSTTSSGGNGWGARVMVNLPLVEDRLALRVDATDEIVPGWIDDAATGKKDINENRIKTGRVKLRYAPTERLNIDLSYWKYWLRTDDGDNLALDNMTAPSYSRTYDPWDVKAVVATYGLENSQLFYSWAGANLRRDSLGSMFDPVASYNSGIRIGIRTQELRWSSTGEHTLDWTAGYYLRKAVRRDHSVIGDAPPGRSTQTNDGYAVYGETILKLPDSRWALTTGLRYFSDRVDALSATEEKRVALNARFSSWNPRLGLSFKPVDNALLYANVARGFRSGQLQPITSFTLNEAAGIDLPTVIRPDSITTYELGAKLQFDEGRLVLGTDVFHSRWKDVAVRVPINSVFNGLVNSEGVRSRGIEFNMTYSPNQLLTLQLGGSYVDAVYVADVPDTPLRKGTPVYNVPKETFSGSIVYRHPIDARLDFTARSVFMYNSARHIGLTTGKPGDAIATVNARLGLESISGWSVYLYGDNLMDDRGALTARTDAGLAYRQRPCSVGLEVSWNY